MTSLNGEEDKRLPMTMEIDADCYNGECQTEIDG